MAKQSKKDDDQKIIDAAIKCLKDYQERESDNIKRAEEAIKFRAGEQWPSAIKQARENPHQEGGPRPCPVMDKTDQYVRQIVNEERQNRAAIRIRPVDDKADKKVAEILTGIVRHIEDASGAISAYTTAGEHAIDGGFGYFRIVTEYEDENSFDQDIRINRIPNRFSVALGPHVQPDGSDAQEAVIWEDMTKDDFESEYPDAEVADFDSGGSSDGWDSKTTVRVAEYICIKRKPSKIHLMEDGTVFDDEQLKQAQDAMALLAQQAPGEPMPSIEPVKSRDTVKKTVKWYKLTSSEILEEKDMIGTYIPVVKVIGAEQVMPDGKVRLSGVVEKMMDPMRVHNYAIAGVIESTALAPRAPWVAPKEAIAGFENDYANANNQNIAVLPYNHISSDGTPIPAPSRTQPAGMAPGWQALIQTTEHGIESSVGMYGPSVGAKSQEKSGIALQEQKSQGMIGNFHFPDNLARSIMHCGRILVEWIPKVYDTQRVARIIGEDDSEDYAELNPEAEQAVTKKYDNFGEEIGLIYNINIGKYDVSVSTGPSYTSKRQEAAQTLMELTSSWPELKQVAGDLLLKTIDAPGMDEMAERAKFLLPPEIRQQEADKDKTPLDPKTQQAMAQVEQMGQQLQEREQMLMQAEQELQAKAQELGSADSEIKSSAAKLEADRRIFEADMKRYKAELALADLQKEHDEMQNNGEEGQVKAYEADMKYKSELAKAAASIIQAQVTASKSEPGEEMEPQDEQPDQLVAVMQILHDAVQKMTAPRETILLTDELGNPVGSRSVVVDSENMQVQ